MVFGLEDYRVNGPLEGVGGCSLPSVFQPRQVKINCSFCDVLLLCLLPWLLGPATGHMDLIALPGRAFQRICHTFFSPPPPTESSIAWGRQLLYFSQFVTQHLDFWPVVVLMGRSHAQMCWCAVWVFLLSFRCSTYCCFKGRYLRTFLTLPCFWHHSPIIPIWLVSSVLWQ